ncbi:MAG: Fic family protein [Nisaea sp.]|uniref:Fic/DOC family protein n=1 Tax=Nisaea sp. TaxID=2024842 RepID=UPI0032639231
MSQLRDKAEREIYERVMYRGDEPRVPVNKLGLRTWKELEEVENKIATRRLKAGIPDRARQLTYDGLKALHHHLFQDVYSWAGQERAYTTGRNAGVPFATPENIRSYLEAEFKKFGAANQFKGLAPGQFAEKVAHFLNEINAAHPFIEGNGRVQRVFLRLISENAGYEISLKASDKELWNEASRIGFLSSDKPMAELIEARLSPLRSLEHAKTAGMDVLAPSATLSPEVSRQELQDRLAASKAVQISTAKLEKQVGIVFSNPKPVLAAIREVAETGKLDDLSIVGELSQIIGLAGKSGVLVARQDRLSRQNAIEGQRGLRSLVGTHINVVHGIRKTIAQERQAVVDKARVEVSAPSQSLTQAIQESRPLSEAHKSELRKVMTTLEERFGSDLGEIRAGVTPERLEELSRKHGLDPKQVERVESTLKVLDKGQIRVRQEARKLEQAKAAEQGRGGPVR